MKLLDNELDNVIFRKDKIVDLCKNKSVLHLGFIQHANLYNKKIEEGDWLHSKIAEVANHLVGIDYLDVEVQKIKREYGYEVYTGDVTLLAELKLTSIFDVIVCGELIEHLENPGLMLAGIKKFMTSETIIIFTTPNPWSVETSYYVRNRIPEVGWVNPEHTMWFSYQTLKQILIRTGYTPIIVDYYYGQSREQFYQKTHIGFLGKIRLLNG